MQSTKLLANVWDDSRLIANGAIQYQSANLYSKNLEMHYDRDHNDAIDGVT